MGGDMEVESVTARKEIVTEAQLRLVMKAINEGGDDETLFHGWCVERFGPWNDLTERERELFSAGSSSKTINWGEYHESR